MAKSELFRAGDKEILAIGTGHVLRDSVNAVRREIKAFQPDIVALELDMNRYLALTRKARGKPAGIIWRLLALLQERAGRTTGIKPGGEMLAAAREAARSRIPVALIDQDIRVTLRNTLRNMTLREKLKLAWGAVFGFIEVGNKETLDSILDQKDELMGEFKRELPGAYRALVTERDDYMARAITQLPTGKVLVVVGAGHLVGIRKRLEYRK